MLSQPAWHGHWQGVEHLIVDEVHALVPTKRGADLAVSLERLAAQCRARPGPRRPLGDLPAGRRRSPGSSSARRGPAGSSRPRRPTATPPPELDVEIAPRARRGPAPRALTYRRLLRRLCAGRSTRTGRRSSSPTPGPSPRRSPTTSARTLDVRPRGRRRAPLGARRRPPARGRGRAEGGRAAGGRHEHEPGAGRRHRHGRPDGHGRPAGQRLAVPPAGRPVGAPGRGRDARADPGRDARRAGRRGRHGRGRARRAGRAAPRRSRRRSTSSASS